MTAAAGGPAFVPENELEQALFEAAADPARREGFLRQLFEAEVFLPMPGPAPSGERLLSAPPGSEIDLPVVESEGRAIVPAFTSMTQLLRYVPEGTGYVQLAVRDLVKLWQDDLWLALNPRGAGVLLGPRDVTGLPGLAGGVGGDGEYVLGRPKREPEEVLKAVRAYAERSGRVHAAYRALMQEREPGAQPRVVVGLELAPGVSRDEVFAQVAEAVRASGVDGVALVPVGAGSTGPVARYLVEETEPFYRRGA